MNPLVYFPQTVIERLPLQKESFFSEPRSGQQLDRIMSMRLAIQEAYRGLGAVSPNPLVGCVILDSQYRFLSKGYHQVFGGPHAEVNALKGLTPEQLKGAHVFVTLEPCAHEGKTPSCAKALAKLPIAEVVYGLRDPNPLVAGQGAEILRAAGIKATLFKDVFGVSSDLKEREKSLLENLEQELEEVCEHFLWNFREKKTFVSLKIASSLDGYLGLKSGESKWITSEESREVAHLLRAAHDAVLVGRGTLITDNPKLNVRHPQIQKKGKVVVLDSQGIALSKLDELELAKIHAPENLYFVLSDKVKDFVNPKGLKILHAPTENGTLHLPTVLKLLWDEGIKSLFVEGGAEVVSSFINEGLAQRLYLFQAPVLLGGKNGRSWSEKVNINSMGSKISLKNQKLIRLSQDILFSGRF